MAESFENLDNILHDWTKDKYKKSAVEALNRYEKNSRKKKDKSRLLLRKWLRRNSRAVRSRARQTKHKIGLGKLRTIV